MKIVAIISNIALLSLVWYILAENGAPRSDEWLIFILLVAAPVINIFVLLRLVAPAHEEPSTYELARQALRAKLQRASRD